MDVLFTGTTLVQEGNNERVNIQYTTLKWHTVSVSWQDNGYMVKYTPLSEGIHQGKAQVKFVTQNRFDFFAFWIYEHKLSKFFGYVVSCAKGF